MWKLTAFSALKYPLRAFAPNFHTSQLLMDLSGTKVRLLTGRWGFLLTLSCFFFLYCYRESISFPQISLVSEISIHFKTWAFLLALKKKQKKSSSASKWIDINTSQRLSLETKHSWQFAEVHWYSVFWVSDPSLPSLSDLRCFQSKPASF